MQKNPYPRPPVAMPLSVECFVEVEHISSDILDTIVPNHLINEGFPLIREGVDEQIPARRGTRWDDLSEKVLLDSLVKGVVICLSSDVVAYNPMNEHRRGITDVIDPYPTLRGRELVIPLNEGVDERSAAFDVLEDRSYLMEIPLHQLIHLLLPPIQVCRSLFLTYGSILSAPQEGSEGDSVDSADEFA